MKVPTPDQALAMLEAGEQDPVYFCRGFLGADLWAMQEQILRAVWAHRRVTVKTCNGVGKSFVGAQALLAYGSLRPKSLILTTATTFEQVRSVLWREAGIAARGARIGIGAEVLQTQIRWRHGSYAMGLTAPERDADKLRGYRARDMLLIADEASGLSPEIFEALMSMMSGSEARLLLISNPSNPTGDYARSFKTEGYHKVSVSAFDSPNFTTFGVTLDDIADGSWEAKVGGRPLPAPHLTGPAWVRERYVDWGPDDPRFRCYVMAEFPSESPDALVPFWQVEAAQRRGISGRTRVDPIELGVDVARTGVDSTVIVLRVGDVAKVKERIRGHDTMQVSGAVMRAIEETGASLAKIDEIGVGAGVLDRLRELKAPVAGINVARGARDPKRYANARAELFFELRDRFRLGDIVLDGETSELAAQVTSIRWRPNSSGQVQIESKDDMRRRGAKSPDEADALMLAFAPPQEKKVFIL